MLQRMRRHLRRVGNDLHIDLKGLALEMGIAYTPENEELLVQCVRDAAAEKFGGSVPVIEVTKQDG